MGVSLYCITNKNKTYETYVLTRIDIVEDIARKWKENYINVKETLNKGFFFFTLIHYYSIKIKERIVKSINKHVSSNCMASFPSTTYKEYTNNNKLNEVEMDDNDLSL